MCGRLCLELYDKELGLAHSAADYFNHLFVSAMSTMHAKENVNSDKLAIAWNRALIVFDIPSRLSHISAAISRGISISISQLLRTTNNDSISTPVLHLSALTFECYTLLVNLSSLAARSRIFLGVFLHAYFELVASESTIYIRRSFGTILTGLWCLFWRFRARILYHCSTSTHLRRAPYDTRCAVSCSTSIHIFFVHILGL